VNKALVVALVVSLPASAAAIPYFRPVEPFHLQPVAPASGVLIEHRSTFFDVGRDLHYGMGWLFEGRLALLDRRLHLALAFPLAMGFVEDEEAVGLGNVEFGAGFGDAIGHGGGRWGVGMRIDVPTATNAPAPSEAGIASRTYNHERHEIDAANARFYADVGIDDGTFVGQVEGGFDTWMPQYTDAELMARFGFLVGVHLAARTILMMEMAWIDAVTSSRYDGRLSLQPGVRFAAGKLDLAFYLSIPVGSPYGGNAFAMGFQLLWNP